MAWVTINREEREPRSGNSFGFCTYSGSFSNSRSFCTCEYPSHLHIPQLLKVSRSHILPLVRRLTPFDCALAEYPGGGAGIRNSWATANSPAHPGWYASVARLWTVDCQLARTGRMPDCQLSTVDCELSCPLGRSTSRTAA